MEKFIWKPLLLSCLIGSVGQLNLGLIFPSLPWIAKDFNLTADQIQLLVSGYLLGFGPSQLVYGPLSDVFGRRPVLLSGLFIAILGLLIGVINANSFSWLLFGRFLQGLGSGSVAVLARATIRDSYQNKSLVKAMTWVAIVAAFTPIAAPVIGGMVNHYWGWFSVFILLLTYIIIIWLVLLFTFTETLSRSSRPPSASKLILSYFTLLQERHFLCFAGIGWINYSLVVISISLMPFIMQVQIGMSSDQYALWTMIPAFGMLIGGVICQRIRPVVGTQKTLQLAPLIHLVAGVVLIMAPSSPLWISVGQFLLTMGNGVAFPCAQSLLFTPYGNRAGTVSALSGACQMVSASLISSILLRSGISQPWHFGMVLLVAAFVGLMLVVVGVKSDTGQQAAAALN